MYKQHELECSVARCKEVATRMIENEDNGDSIGEVFCASCATQMVKLLNDEKLHEMEAWKRLTEWHEQTELDEENLG